MAEPSGPSRTQSDKNASKQMSRSVGGATAGRQQTRNGAARTATRSGTQAGGPRRSDGRSGGGRGGGTPPPRGRSPRPTPARRPRRSPTALLTWGTAALVIVIVVVLVVVKVTGGSSPSTATPWTPVSPTVSAQLANIPASVFNTVGTNSTVAPIYKPIVISGQPALTYADGSGKQLPGVFFYGAEYCPHCAAERWALVVALERFGTLKKLGNMTSSSVDSPPSIPTFTFSKATYSSPYFVLRTDEAFSNELNAAQTAYKTLQIPTAAEQKLIETYDSNKYFPDIPQGEQAFPLVDFGNKILSEENFAPNFLQGLSRDQIAAGLSDAKNPITQAIVASANLLSASICAIDGGQPSSVCASKGVVAAAKALNLSI